MAWLDQRLSEQNYRGIAMSVPGAVNQETGVIEGISAIPYIHCFSWYEALAHHQLPVHLENDANCVGLSELLAHPEIENAACVVIGTGIGGAMIINGKIHRGLHGLGGEFGYMTTNRTSRKTQQLVTISFYRKHGSLCHRKIMVKPTGMAVRFTKRLQQAMPFAKKPLSG